MPALSHITSEMTVRQVATSWPACAEVLVRWSEARMGERWTLQELSSFARDQGLDEARLMSELATAAGVEQQPPRKPARLASPLKLIFIALAICLTVGSSWGVALLLAIASGTSFSAVSGASIHVHGATELWGWMALFVFAIGSHLLRQNTKKPAPLWLERAAAGLIVAAILSFFIGLVTAVRQAIPAIDVIASAGLAGAAILFGICVIWSSSGQKPSQRIRSWMFIIGWLWVWAGVDVWLHWQSINMPVLSESARQLLIALPVLGFAVNAIYGFGIRLIPGFLNITALRQRCFTIAILTHSAGLCLFLLVPGNGATAGAALMLAAAVIYLIGMNGLVGKPARPIFGVDPRGHILIRAAFAWLIIGLAMVLIETLIPGLPHAYAGAWRHALTVGFITTMILGVGQRLVPIFIKQPLASANLMLVGAALIIVGCAGRVGLELATMTGQHWTYQLMGVTGILELTAIALFAINLAMTVHRRKHIYEFGEVIRPDTRVREVINAQPEIQERLHDIGVTMFDQSPFIAPSMTFGALAHAWGCRPDELVGRIRSVGRAAGPADKTEKSASQATRLNEQTTCADRIE